MKNKFLLILAGLALIGSTQACTITFNNNGAGRGVVMGSGIAKAEDRSISNVNGVELAIQGDMDITVGSSETLRIEADDNLLPYIQTEVSLGTLRIHSTPGYTLQSVRPIKYHLTVVKLNAIGLSSSGNVQVGDLKSASFSVSISSSGNLSMNSLACNSLLVSVSSSGDARISTLNAEMIRVNISSSGNLDIGGGQVGQQTISISNSGAYRAGDLASSQADVTLSSSGEATIRVSERLNGRLSSSGNINYIGSPVVNVSTSSSGRARQIGK